MRYLQKNTLTLDRNEGVKRKKNAKNGEKKILWQFLLTWVFGQEVKFYF